MRAFCNTRSYFHMEKAALVTNFPFSRKMLMSKKYERPSLFFSIKKLMLGCLDDQYSLNFLNGREKTIQTSSTYRL